MFDVRDIYIVIFKILQYFKIVIYYICGNKVEFRCLSDFSMHNNNLKEIELLMNIRIEEKKKV